jgi:vacuolar protein sorting-associated protein 72
MKVENEPNLSEHGEDEMEEGEYDMMDYGDEMNDEEERKYAREMYGKKSEPPVKRESRPVRANRGNRMDALVEKAAQQ